jgi:Predicted membrane protein (DUF2079)
MTAKPRPLGPDSALFFAALAALYAAILTAKFGLWHGNALQADWTYYNNIFWNTNFHDLWLFSYDRFKVYGYITYLNEHFAPLLIPLAAIYQLMPWPHAFLLMLHGAAPILAAIGIRAIGMRLLGDRNLATVVALVYALNPGILWPTISLVYGFEPDSLLPACAVLAGFGLATRRDGLYFAGLLLGCGIKENVPAYGVILGLCLIIFTERRRLGIWSVVLSLAIFIVASKGVPYFTGVENANINIVWKFLSDVVHLHPHMDYTWPQLAFAAVYCAFFFPALFVLPFLAVIGPDVLAIGQAVWATTGTWHVMLPVTVLGIASVFGTAQFLAFRSQGAVAALDRRIERGRLVRLYWRAALVASLLAGPATLALAYHRYIAQAVPVDRAALAEAIKLIPPKVGLATTADLDQYFAQRKIVTSRPSLLQKTPADFPYLAVNRRALTAARTEGNARDGYKNDACMIKIAEAAAAAGNAVVLDQGGLLIVKLAALPSVVCG